MPKIQAATVAEHRQAQRRSLLDATRAMLHENPHRAPVFAEVASRAGLARSSVYQYFGSRDELLSAVLADAFPRWSQQVCERMASVSSPAGRVLSYVRVNLELFASGEHSLARVLMTLIGDDIAAYSCALHDELRTPLVAALRAGGAEDPDTTADLIDAVVHAAARKLERGDDLSRTTTRATELLNPYLAELAARSAH